MPVNKSVPGSHATKMEISGRTLVSFRKKWRNGEILIIFRAFAFTHSFAFYTCKLGQRKRKCKRKVKTAWTRGRLLRWHLRRTCEPGLYKRIHLTVTNPDDKIMYDETTAVRVSQWRFFLWLKSALSSDTLATNSEYELRKALICFKPFIPTYFQ